MFYLILAILSSVSLTIIFKLYPKWKVDTFQAIVYNYIVCVITGAIFLGELPMDTQTLTAAWMPHAMVLGLLFIVGFYAAGKTVEYFGVAIAAVVQRMVLMISVPFAIFIMGEASTLPKWIGVFLASFAVILTNWKAKTNTEAPIITNEEEEERHNYLWIYPLGIFSISAAIECMLQYVQATIFVTGGKDEAVFSIYLFGIAAVLGVFVLIYNVLKGRFQWSWATLGGGILLGIPNYFSIYFLLKAFDWQDKSIILPINNIAVVSIAALLGFLIFRERLAWYNWLGVLVAIAAIVVMSV